MKTVLITGASSGIGKAIAEHFVENGWQVAATMRSPEKSAGQFTHPNIRLYQLDVTDQNSISSAIQSVISDLGQLDVVVNNAGYGTVGIFEKASPDQIQRQFNTNVFGVMNVTRGILPHFRSRKSGTIINITSVGGLITFPLYSVYHATKWAVEGFSESLHYELKPLNIRVKTVEPPAIKTDFYTRSQDLFKKDGMPDYDKYETVVYKNTQDAGFSAPGPEVIAKTVFRAANDTSFRLRYAGNWYAAMIISLKRFFPLTVFRSVVKSVTEKGL